MFEQIPDPCFPQIHMLPGKSEIPVGKRGAGHHHEHIPGFLHRHLPLLGVVRVDLSGQNRILPTVVRREIKTPRVAFRVPDDRPHHAAHQLRIVEKIERDRRIAHIHRGGAAVREAFLGDKEDLSARIYGNLMRRDGLTIGQLQDLRVLFSARFHTVCKQLCCKRSASFLDRRIFPVGSRDRFSDGHTAPVPVGMELFPEIED